MLVGLQTVVPIDDVEYQSGLQGLVWKHARYEDVPSCLGEIGLTSGDPVSLTIRPLANTSRVGLRLRVLWQTRCSPIHRISPTAPNLSISAIDLIHNRFENSAYQMRVLQLTLFYQRERSSASMRMAMLDQGLGRSTSRRASQVDFILTKKENACLFEIKTETMALLFLLPCCPSWLEVGTLTSRLSADFFWQGLRSFPFEAVVE